MAELGSEPEYGDPGNRESEHKRYPTGQGSHSATVNLKSTKLAGKLRIRMVDIHCHIIPAIDDGADSMDATLTIIRSEVAAGTTAFIASPHVYTDEDLMHSSQIPERLEQVRQAVDEEGIAVELFAGAEVYPFNGLLDALDRGDPITAGGHGKHILVDLPMHGIPMDMAHLLFEIQTRGVTPILAHPERNSVFQEDLPSLKYYLDRGILCQVNAASLRGKYGEKAKEIAMTLLMKHWPSFLASDVHKAKHGGILGPVARQLADTLDPGYLQIITRDAGWAIARGEAVPANPEPKYVQRVQPGRTWLSRLLSR
jgi:protein-tyrosine phosphatase